MGSVNKATVTWSFETDVMCQRSACETLRYTLLATVERQTAINLDSDGLSMEAEIFDEFWTVFYLGTFSLTRTIPQFTKVWAGTPSPLDARSSEAEFEQHFRRFTKEVADLNTRCFEPFTYDLEYSEC